MKDSLGDRIKSQYENRTRISLPRRTYTIIRIDGKAFHSYTKHLEKPFDYHFIEAMNRTAIYLCKNIQGAKYAYTQSDEISILLTDFENPQTEAWFDGNIQKMCSVAAAMATMRFNAIAKDLYMDQNAVFDARAFTIPDPVEVENYFIWRQNDAVRNSIQMVARYHFSHKECNKKNTSQLQDMIHSAGDNWNDYPARVKRGGVTIKDEHYGWVDTEAPWFTKERDKLIAVIPKIHGESNAD